MKKMFKLKMLGLLFSGILFSSNTVTYASEVFYTEENTAKIETTTKITQEVYARVALDFANGILPDKNLSVTAMTPILNSENEILSYDCKLSENDVDYGYVIVDMSLDGDYISEFNLEKNVPDFYEQMIQNVDERTNENVNKDDIPESEQVLIETLPNEYSVVVEDTALTSSGKVMDADELEMYQEEVFDVIGESITTASQYGHTGDVMQNYPSDYSFQANHMLPYFISMTQGQSESAAGKYACAVTAMTIVADRYGLGQSWVPSNLKTTYNNLWSKSSTKETSRTVKNGKTIIYGGTPVNKIGPALVSLGKDKKVNLKYKDASNPSFTTIRNAISNKHDVIFSYFISSTKGHSVSVQGTWTGKKNNKNHDFIILADGWGMSARYINYTTKSNTVINKSMTEIWK
ncbi:hypothetical protein IGI58_002629 [Enterococcus sp. AZ020]